MINSVLLKNILKLINIMRIFIFIVTSLMISCADMVYEKENQIEDESIVGY